MTSRELTPVDGEVTTEAPRSSDEEFLAWCSLISGRAVQTFALQMGMLIAFTPPPGITITVDWCAYLGMTKAEIMTGLEKWFYDRLPTHNPFTAEGPDLSKPRYAELRQALAEAGAMKAWEWAQGVRQGNANCWTLRFKPAAL